MTTSGDRCNIEYPSESHLQFKYREISFVQNIHSSCQIVLKICTEHGNDTVVFCGKFQNDFAAGHKVIDKRDFARFGFKVRFGRISFVATAQNTPEEARQI